MADLAGDTVLLSGSCIKLLGVRVGTCSMKRDVLFSFDAGNGMVGTTGSGMLGAEAGSSAGRASSAGLSGDGSLAGSICRGM
jgi:hypothetical protein